MSHRCSNRPVDHKGHRTSPPRRRHLLSHRAAVLTAGESISLTSHRQPVVSVWMYEDAMTDVVLRKLCWITCGGHANLIICTFVCSFCTTKRIEYCWGGCCFHGHAVASFMLRRSICG